MNYSIKWKIYLGLFTSAFFISSCEKQTNWEFDTQDNNELVVEAIITNELKTQEVFLSQSFTDLNSEVRTVSDAVVRFSDGIQTLVFQNDTSNPGRYYSAIPFQARLNRTYSLEIFWQQKTYEARNSMIAVLPYTRLSVKSSGDEGLYEIGSVANLYSPVEQAMYEVDIDWSHITNSDTSKAKLYFYTLSTLDVNEVFRPEKEVVRFPRGSIIKASKFSLNDSFADYYRAMLMETEWQGGFFDEASSSIPTNISNGGLGFFGVSAVLRDTFVVQ